MINMDKWINCSKIGRKKEQEFAELLTNNFGGLISLPSKEDDMYNHIDIIWTYNNQVIKFDVKSAKKNSRSDNLPNYDINWIELQNVRGNLGWVFGKADYIAFEGLHDWVIVKRVKLIELINCKVINKSISKTKDFYTYYQRDGRQDIVVKVPMVDIYNIASKILNKIH